MRYESINADTFGLNNYYWLSHWFNWTLGRKKKYFLVIIEKRVLEIREEVVWNATAFNYFAVEQKASELKQSSAVYWIKH
jgi:hypothetical protein